MWVRKEGDKIDGVEEEAWREGEESGREGGGEEVIECGVGEKRGFDRQGWVKGICHGNKERCIVHVWVWGGLLGR